ncbi:DUF6134 family protein [Arthrospiribacter ruber]|uniref:DUF4390 domain-containing protein n=1 Tax=Arthrospiribacter ruber TaxID=2487934 RepID=A0A951IY98_9BACT|nr:DUF6134 family protein [Arthrospiribacter ruber]MBW3468494.1 hypothetical protein [Arthrospiribacter ruber]
MRKKPFLILLLGFCWVKGVSAQETVLCDITVAGIKIGEMEAIKKIDASFESYEIQSQVRFWFFSWIDVSFDAEAQYENGILQEAKSNTSSNRGDFSSHILLDNGRYQVNAKMYKFENEDPVLETVHLSTSKLYFEEPIDNAIFLAENFGLLSRIKKKGNYYEVEVNGNKNRFYYENGDFVKAVMQSPIKNYVVSRK